jgi:hypothetical protein
MLNRYAHFVEEQRQAVASAMDSILTRWLSTWLSTPKTQSLTEAK